MSGTATGTVAVAVLGAGHGGLAAAADLARRGFHVRLWNRGPEPVERVTEAGGIRSSGAIGEGLVRIDTATTDLGRAIAGADVVVIVLPAPAHGEVFAALASTMLGELPIVLDPGHMCGSLHLRRMFEIAGRPVPPCAELGTLSYICRSSAPASVQVSLRTREVPMAVSGRIRPEVRALTADLFPGTRAAGVVETWLHDVNLVLHPPGMLLGAAWIEGTDGGFGFYTQGVTPSVERTMLALDMERRAVGRAFGLDLPALTDTMAAYGSADLDRARAGDLRGAIRGGAANAGIQAPTSVDHRYLHEDVGFGLVPLVALARIAGIPTPVAEALIVLAETITARPYRREGLTAEVLGIAGMDVEAFTHHLEHL
ncbi:MAG TPA: NAD/NADP octopine/nopaline dehydrogenase family protein [Actinomycetota bacterium]|nr:NAD/NADP octopine/nopaline dehydrogenase family protein [Actinomycetota bacterium]